MRQEFSVYRIPCLCGNTVESHEPETDCKACGRLLKVENWGQTADQTETNEQPKPITKGAGA